MFEKHKDKLILLGIILFIAGLTIKSYRPSTAISKNSLFNEEAFESETSEIISNENIFVHIVGEVKKPNLYELKADSRLKDLIDMAGGFTDLANQESINLALKLEDEMMVRDPSINDNNEDYNSQILGISGAEPEEEKININDASLDDLQKLPNIGPKTAEKIIQFREEENFETIEDIMNVNGIGEKTFEEIKEMIRVN